MIRIIKIGKRRRAFTLVEMLVVIGIILVIAALAAAFAPRIADDTNLSRAVDNLEQWLLTAKMRAKRDGLATGIRFIQTQGDVNIDPSLKLVPPGPPTIFSQVQYIQHPDPLSGGWWTSAGPVGGVLQTAGGGTVTFQLGTVDFSLGGMPQYDLTGQPQWLVQPGDYLEVRDGGVYSIAAVPTANTLQLYATATDTYGASLTIAAPGTTNYRILRQPRILIGEEPLTLPNNFAVNFNFIPGTTTPGCNVVPRIVNPTTTPPVQYYEILFSPTGAVVGTNAGAGMLFISVYDTTMNPFDINRVGIVVVQTRTGFLGAYGVAPGVNPFYFAQIARESGL